MADELTQIADVLPDYEVERELGRGGMGVVLLGHHRRLGRPVAIKELPQTFATEPDIRDRFTTEARTLATLSHPHIVPVYDYVERGALCLIVMEELPGGTVWERFTTIGLTAPAACAIALACCSALQHAHDKGVLHLDVKPDNLMFDGSGTIKVTDFGISRVISGDRLLATVDGQVLGTPAYMSPEQARGASLDPASDVYSTGVMLYELLSGRLPWSGAESASELLLQRLDEAPRPLRDVAPHVPQVLADVVMHGLERDASKRYRRSEDFGLAIASACAEAWGPTWLDHAGVLLIGSERLSIAARTTRDHTLPPRDSGGVPPAARSTGPNDTGTAAPGTIISSGDSTRAGETITTGDVQPEIPRAGATRAEPAAVSASMPASEEAAAAPVEPLPSEFKVVRAEAAEPRIRGADLNQLGRADLVDLREALQAPDFPRISLALAVLFLVAAVVATVILFGATKPTGNIPKGQASLAGVDVTGSKAPSIDLSKDVPLVITKPGLGSLANRAKLKLSVVGIPLGEISTDVVNGRGTFAPNITEHLASGNVRGELEVLAANKQVGDEKFDVVATNSWIATALGIVSLLLVLAGLANLESSLRTLRRRTSVGSLIGAFIAGAIFAAGLLGVLTAAGKARPTTSGIIAGLACTAFAFAFGAHALGLVARRRRVNRALRRAVRSQGLRVAKT
jgi:serine/threonine protein kinase